MATKTEISSIQITANSFIHCFSSNRGNSNYSLSNAAHQVKKCVKFQYARILFYLQNGSNVVLNMHQSIMCPTCAK